MRRLLALVPALLILAATIPAQGLLSEQTVYCNIHNREGGRTVSASVDWERSGTKDRFLLDGLTVDDNCQKYWVQVYFRGTRSRPDTTGFTFYIQPGVHQTLGRDILDSLGVYQRPFFHWAILNGWEQSKPPRNGPFCLSYVTPTPVVFVMADTSIYECPFAA